MKIFITGGSRGIGRRIVTMALERGHDVAFTYNSSSGGHIEEMMKETAKLAPDRMCKGYQLDVRDVNAVIKVTDAVLDDFDSIDTVINNAAINRNNLAFS